MLSMVFAPVVVSEDDSATADMNNPPSTWLPKVEVLHVSDKVFALGTTNADAVVAAASKSADRTDTFFKNSIFISFVGNCWEDYFSAEIILFMILERSRCIVIVLRVVSVSKKKKKDSTMTSE